MSKSSEFDNEVNNRRIMFVIELFVEQLASIKSLEGFTLFKALCNDFNVDCPSAWEQYQVLHGNFEENN